MSAVGQIEKKTQARVVALFRDRLGYDYLGNWIDNPHNRNIESDLLTAWLRKQGVADTLISRALFALNKRLATPVSIITTVTAPSMKCFGMG